MKFKPVISLILFFSVITLCQSNEGIMARIGDKTISVREFRQRYELSPFVSFKSSWNEDSIKYDFFYSLIAEKLWSMHAMETGLDNHNDFQFYYKPLEDIILRDALFKEEIENKVNLSADDINNGIMKSQTTLKTLLISSEDSSSMFNFFSKFRDNEKTDSLLSLFPALAQQILEIKFGLLKDEETENLLYSLKIDEFTDLIKSEIGWVVFLVKDRSSLPVDLSDEKTVNDIKKTIRMRRIQKRYEEYLSSLLSGIRISADEKIFRIAAGHIIDRLSLKTPRVIGKDSAVFFLDENDYRKIRSDIGKEILSGSLFPINKKNIPLDDFLAILAFKEFNVTGKDTSLIYRTMNRYLKIFMEEQLITAEAYQKKLFLDPAVRDELEMWKDNFLAQMLKVSYLDSINISDDEAFDYYINTASKDSNKLMLNLQLLSLSSLNEISDILDKVRDGQDFGSIIKSYGNTDPLVNENGETGMKPVILLGDIGIIASKLELNQLYGPVRRNNNYSLFRVIGKSNSTDSIKISFESDKHMLKNKLRIEEFNSLLERKTAEFASGKNFSVNETILKNTGTNQIKMFVHRMMGFGGRIAAVPVTDNWADWIDTYELKKKLLP